MQHIFRNNYMLNEVLRYNHNNEARIPAIFGYLKAYKYSDYLKYDEHTMDIAAANGHLNVLKWLHKNRKDGCSKKAMLYAVDNDHFHVVRWLHQNRTEGCTRYAIDSAAMNGNLEMVKWLFENRTEGCSRLALLWAAQNGFTDIVNYIKTQENIGRVSESYDSLF